MEPIAFKSRSGLMPLRPKEVVRLCQMRQLCRKGAHSIELRRLARGKDALRGRETLLLGKHSLCRAHYLELHHGKQLVRRFRGVFLCTDRRRRRRRSLICAASAYHPSPSPQLQESGHEYALPVLDPSSFEERSLLTRSCGRRAKL